MGEKYNIKSIFHRITRGQFLKGDIDDAGRWDVVPTKISMDEILSVDMTPQDKQNYGGDE